MPRVSKQSVEELRRVFKETTGSDLSVSEGYVALHYLLQLTRLIGNVERRASARPQVQLSLFD
ncbi:MAG TPA: hypothetical protein VMR46_01855 [Candidatus Paceibacterota bacterium]|nr:hypothetical protein [Candidatus Paceibacterota bacterium]